MENFVLYDDFYPAFTRWSS